MILKVNDDDLQITNSINRFRTDYHKDYFIVREISRKYLSDSKPNSATVALLAKGLRQVLINWGAGKRKAPKPRGIIDFERALTDPVLHADLSQVAQIKISRLGVSGVHKLIDMQKPKPDELKAIDAKLLFVLNCLAEKLFIDNSNATYPMKAALLITAHMPAFDGNVRNGLKRGGYAGFYSTRFILPKNTSSADSKKITSLPYILGGCWNSCKDIFIEGVSKSNYPSLLEDPARVFDILLFMQANNPMPALLQHPSGYDTWNELR
jgi:hypothetical protein